MTIFSFPYFFQQWIRSIKYKLTFPHLGSHVTILRNLTYESSQNIYIGNNVYLNHDIDLIAKNGKIVIENDVGIGPGTYICAFKHNYEDISKTIGKQGDSYGETIIGKYSWIGAHCVILCGVKIGEGAVVGAGSVVTKDVPRYAVVGGVPAKVIKIRDTESLLEPKNGKQLLNALAIN